MNRHLELHSKESEKANNDLTAEPVGKDTVPKVAEFSKKTTEVSENTDMDEDDDTDEEDGVKG